MLTSDFAMVNMRSNIFFFLNQLHIAQQVAVGDNLRYLFCFYLSLMLMLSMFPGPQTLPGAT